MPDIASLINKETQEKIQQLFPDSQLPTHEEQRLPKYAMSVVSTVAYLIGVPEEYFGKDYLISTYQALEAQEPAKLMRTLCTLRNSLMKNIGHIITRSREGVYAIENMPDYADPALFAYLSEHRIRISGKSNKIQAHIANVNSHISNNIFNCKPLFPTWVNWEYVKSIFVMPKGSKENVVSEVTRTFNYNWNSYPYQCYINWKLNDVRYFHEFPEYDLDAKPEGNVIANDRKFLVLLYRLNNAEFTDFSHVTTADEQTRTGIDSYMMAVQKCIMVVDAENSDPYKLVSFLHEWKEHALRNGQPDPLYKIAIIDDYHTIDAWDVVSDYTHIAVEHTNVNRILGHKSRVDMVAALTAQRAALADHADGIILASSDSDFFSLLEDLPDVRFMILGEQDKLSGASTNAYSQAGAFVCMIDDFVGNLSDIRKGALMNSLETYLTDHLSINLDELLSELYERLRLDFTSKEKAQLRDDLIRAMKLSVAANGDMSVKVQR